MTTGNFDNLTGAELLDAYNTLCGLTGDPPRKAKFHDREQGIARCEALQAKLPQPPPTKAPPVVERPSLARLAKRIRLQGGDNPHREGTRAHKYFEAMRGGPTIGEYLDKFEDRDDANLYLWTECRNGRAEVLG